MGEFSYTNDEGSLIGMVFRWVAVFAIVSVLLGFLGSATGWFNLFFWAPKVEQARYNVFKESQAYNESAIRDLYDYKRDWDRGDDKQKLALKGAILHQFSVYDKNKLPMDLQLFYTQVEGL